MEDPNRPASGAGELIALTTGALGLSLGASVLNSGDFTSPENNHFMSIELPDSNVTVSLEQVGAGALTGLGAALTVAGLIRMIRRRP